MKTTSPCAPFSYADRGKTPARYVCKTCGAKDVRLYREYQTVLEYQVLHCRACAIKHANKGDNYHPELQANNEEEHSIGWLVAAVPTEDGSTYWGFTSVPQAGVDWWEALPK